MNSNKLRNYDLVTSNTCLYFVIFLFLFPLSPFNLIFASLVYFISFSGIFIFPCIYWIFCLWTFSHRAFFQHTPVNISNLAGGNIQYLFSHTHEGSALKWHRKKYVIISCVGQTATFTCPFLFDL